MNLDEFEKQLRQQPLRQIPEEWREEILDAARRIQDPQPSTSNARPTSWWRELLWPCPQAWAGLAAAWIAILFLNGVSREPVRTTSSQTRPHSPELMMVLREQRRLFAELIGSSSPVEPPKTFDPRPRSEASPRTIAV